MAIRQCGGCTACCKTHAVPAVRKIEFEWCPHCETGAGCRIYESRPLECRAFACLWTAGEGTESERPDKSRCVLDIDVLEGLGMTLTIHELRPGAYEKSALAQHWTRRMFGASLAVWIRRARAQDTLMLPPRLAKNKELVDLYTKAGVRVQRYDALS